MKTAQESVQQALEALENASSEVGSTVCAYICRLPNPSIRTQDEKRAAKLQVQSLLQRADELVLTLKVKYHFSLDIPFTQCTCHRMQLATEVRKELAHAYKDISEAKEKNLQVSTDENMSRPRA